MGHFLNGLQVDLLAFSQVTIYVLAYDGKFVLVILGNQIEAKPNHNTLM